MADGLFPELAGRLYNLAGRVQAGYGHHQVRVQGLHEAFERVKAAQDQHRALYAARAQGQALFHGRHAEAPGQLLALRQAAELERAVAVGVGLDHEKQPRGGGDAFQLLQVFPYG